MRYYMKSTDARYVSAIKELREMASARHTFFKELAQGWGFDEVGQHDFGVPSFFFKRTDLNTRERKGPVIEGFKGGQLHHEDGQVYFSYQFSRSKKASELRKQFNDAPPAPADLDQFVRPNISSAFCKRFGLPNMVFHGNRIGFAIVHLLHNDLVACSLPCREDDSKEAAPAVFPDGFEEITERAWHAEIDSHNKALKEQQR